MRGIFLSIILITLFISACLFTGCGKKGDPLPPVGNEPKPPIHLKYSLDRDNSTVRLSWKIFTRNDTKNSTSDTIKNQNTDIKGTELFRAALRLSDNGCKNCPLQFERVAYIPYPLSEYSYSIERGFIYFYKVRSYTESNISSPFSETVEFEFK